MGERSVHRQCHVPVKPVLIQDSGLLSEAPADTGVIGFEVFPQLQMLAYFEGLLTSLAAVRIKSVVFRVTFPNVALFVVTKVLIRIMIKKSHCLYHRKHLKITQLFCIRIEVQVLFC